MSISIFADKQYEPTEAEMLAVVGARAMLWQALVAYVRATYTAQEDLKYLYGRKYGWAVRFRLKGALLLSLYPADGAFTAQINLSPEAVEQTRSMDLGPHAQSAIDRAHPYPEGRWLFIRVESDQDAQDVRRLLSLRVQTKRLNR